MAQDILITPGSGEPQILFRGSGTTDTAVELNVLSSYQSATGSGTALLYEGTEGLLFGVTDNLSSGTIFSVSDISGLPTIEVDASGDVKLGEYGRYVGVGSGVPAYGFDVSSSGRFEKGFVLSDYVPAVTTNTLYNDGGTLKFNGSAVGGGTDTYTSGVATYASGQAIENEGLATYASGQAISNESDLAYTSGVAAYSSGVLTAGPSSGIPFYGDAAQHGAITTSDNLVYDSGSHRLRLSDGTDGAALQFGDDYMINKGNVRFLFKVGGSDFAAGILQDGSAGRVSVDAGGYYSWTDSAGTPHGSPTLKLYRDAADTLAQRRDANAQEFRLYNSGDTTNYERLSLKWDSNEAIIQTQAGGTGTQRSLIFDAASATNIPITARGAASQSANLQEWQTNAGTAHLALDSNFVFQLDRPAGTNHFVVDDARNYTFGFPDGHAAFGDNTFTNGVTSRDGGATVNRNKGFFWNNGTMVYGGAVDTALFRPSAGNVVLVSGSSSGDPLGHLSVSGITLTSVNQEIDTASNVGYVLKGASAQSADLAQYQSSAGIVIAKITSDGSIASSGTISASGGVLLDNIVPSVTTNKLYNDGGTLKFNGSAVGGGGGVDAYTSGVAAYSSGVLTGGTASFLANSATDTPITAKGAASQSANLQEWQANDDVVVAQVGPDGSIATSGNVSVSGDITSNGRILLPAGSVGSPSITFTGGASNRVGIYEPVADTTLGFVTGGGTRLAIRTRIMTATSTGGFAFTDSSSNPHSSTIDTYLKRYAAGQVGIYDDNGTTLGDLVVSGVYASGVTLTDHVPASTTNALYNDGGTLKFNGSAVGGGGSSLTAGSGVIVDGADRINIHGGTGNFQEIQLTSDNIFTPQIVFTASGVADTPVKLKVLSNQPTPSSSGTALSFEGKEGQLFGITDNLSSGTIFSVNDITGLPLISADASGDVKLGEYGRYVGVGTGVPLYDFDVSSSGQFQKGIILSDYLPATTTNAIYNDGGVLKFNGFVVSSDSVPASDTPTTEDATITLDLSTGNYHNVVLGNNVTKFEFLNAKRGQRFLLRITQHAASAKTIAWTNVDYTSGGAAATVRWAGGGTAPTMSTSTSHTDVYGFLCTNNAGSAFDGFVVGQDLPD